MPSPLPNEIATQIYCMFKEGIILKVGYYWPFKFVILLYIISLIQGLLKGALIVSPSIGSANESSRNHAYVLLLNLDSNIHLVYIVNLFSYILCTAGNK